MTFLNRTKLSLCVILTLTLAGFGTAVWAASPTKAETDIAENLRDIEVQTLALDNHVQELDVLTFHPFVSWQMHSWELIRAADALEEVAEVMPELQNQSEKVEWQKKMIDSVGANFVKVSERIEAAREIVAEEKSVDRLQLNEDYRKHISALKDLTSDLEAQIDYLQARYNLEIAAKYGM